MGDSSGVLEVEERVLACVCSGEVVHLACEFCGK